MADKKKPVKRQPQPAPRQPERPKYGDRSFAKPVIPWYGNPRIIITIGIIVIFSFIAVPLISLFAAGSAPARQPTPDVKFLTQPTLTPTSSPTPSPTSEPAAATATAQAIALTATALAPTPTATPDAAQATATAAAFAPTATALARTPTPTAIAGPLPIPTVR